MTRINNIFAGTFVAIAGLTGAAFAQDEAVDVAAVEAQAAAFTADLGDFLSARNDQPAGIVAKANALNHDASFGPVYAVVTIEDIESDETVTTAQPVIVAFTD